MAVSSLSSLGAKRRTTVVGGAQFVTFRLGAEEYGIAISKVREIIRVQSVTHLPDMPSFMEGVINLRGHVIPVIDLRKRFRLAPEPSQTAEPPRTAEPSRTVHEQARLRFIIVVQVEADASGTVASGNRTVGFIVDSVSQVLKAREDQIEAPPPDVARVGRKYLSGICKLDRRMVVILDTNAILSSEESQALEKVS